ncbi:hypothetical protein RUM43_014094 [Polyplax serrata]|uniref:F-box domain-containing protein n=1 Tax=Polyplax serrata TaxID=468196 RepID=A0AAN8S6Y1_POLSC
MEELPYSQKLFNFPIKNIQTLIQPEVKEEIQFVEQYVSEVLDFSSQYGSDTSISYTAYNLTGKPSKFPDYGDFPQAFVMKTYGNWWKEAPSRLLEYMPQNTPKISSNDFVDISFEESVYPFRISVYETYNPGAVVRIWAKNDLGCKKKWELLWEGEPTKVEHIPRIFSPVIRIINFKTSVLRIEFNHSKLDYYTGIDAVLLVGTKQPIRAHISNSNKFLKTNDNEKIIESSPIVLGKLTQQIFELNLHNIPDNMDDSQETNTEVQVKPGSENLKYECHYNGRFQCLPDETILKILGYLDLVTLRRCAHLNKHFHSLCNDSFLYTHLSLQPYWNKLSNSALLSLASKCSHLQKLDLSWCGSYSTITPEVFDEFLLVCGKTLTHIRLNCCKFVMNTSMKVLGLNQHLKEVSLRNCNTITDLGFHHLADITQLENLDLYRTNITSNSLKAILKSNKNLLHLNLGSCIKITNIDEVVLALAENNRKLISLDLWKMSNLTQVGVAALNHCSQLEEVDFGWCLGFTLPVDSLCALAIGCPKLKKLFLTALRGICDKDLEPFIKSCPDLEQIDLLGVRGITPDICLRLLTELPKLRLLDLSFCDQISDIHVSEWKRLFPDVSIKRSFQTEVMTNFLYQSSLH